MRIAVLLLSVLGDACGSSPASVTAVESIAGTWTGTATVVSVSGGECLAPAYLAVVGFPIGVNPFPISQTGDNVATKLTLLYPSTDCPYSGVATGPGFNLAAANCGTYLSRRCEVFSGIPGDTRVRDISFVSATFAGSVAANAMTATAVETWSINAAGTQTNVGVLTLTSRFNLTR